MAARQGGVAKRYKKVMRLAARGVKRLAGVGGVGEVTVAMGALTMGRGMFSTRMSLFEMWSTMSLVSWSCAQFS